MNRRVKIAPSILSADFACVADSVRAVERAGADYLHIDVMDGRFVPNITWGPKIVRDLRRCSSIPFDCHLMIVEPERYVDDFRGAGADIITFHLEATAHAQRLLSQIRASGARAGLSINPQTPVAMLEDIIDDVDVLLVMSVNPGFGGQRFLPRSLEKIRQARALLHRRGVQCELEVDGGIKDETIRDVVAAGADVVVIGSSVFDGGDAAERVAHFRRLLSGA